MMHFERESRGSAVKESTVLAIGVGAGVLAGFAGAQPTGQVGFDWFLVAVSVAVAVWAAASAPWWAPTAAAGVAMITALNPFVVGVAAIGFLLGCYLGVRGRDRSWNRALIAALAMNALCRSELAPFFGLSAIVGVSCGLLLFVIGLSRRPQRVRQRGLDRHWRRGRSGPRRACRRGTGGLQRSSLHPECIGPHRLCDRCCEQWRLRRGDSAVRRGGPWLRPSRPASRWTARHASQADPGRRAERGRRFRAVSSGGCGHSAGSQRSPRGRLVNDSVHQRAHRR